MKAKMCAMVAVTALLATASSSRAQMGMPSWIPFHSVYVRGDIGGAFGIDTRFRNDPAPIGAGSTQKSELGNSLMYGGGVGVRINPMFRTDITVDLIRRLDITGSNSVAGAPSSSAHVSSLVGMLNGYFDLNGVMPNLFGPLQPYLQAGVGAARNDLSRTSFATGAGAYAGSVSSHARTSFAWGAGAGIAYAIMPNLSLDLGYKYLDLGHMSSGTTFSVGSVGTNTGRMRARLGRAHGDPRSPLRIWSDAGWRGGACGRGRLGAASSAASRCRHATAKFHCLL